MTPADVINLHHGERIISLVTSYSAFEVLQVVYSVPDNPTPFT